MNTDFLSDNFWLCIRNVCNKQVKLYGRTKKAILKTTRICKDRNVLKKYLESREKGGCGHYDGIV